MKENLDIRDFKRIMQNINETIQDNRIVLSKLDSIIGDGDHGVTMAKGLEAAMEKLKDDKPANISLLLKTAGNAITMTIGGVAGPIFGTFFSEMGRVVDASKEFVDLKDLAVMFRASLEKIMRLGGAKPGDKTMVDALEPAVKDIEISSTSANDIKASMESMAKAAKKGAESTKDMVSLKGKSSYSGERSLGYEDAGANTVYFILKAFYEAI
jgi:dihydroxyacetone kinase-like protein